MPAQAQNVGLRFIHVASQTNVILIGVWNVPQTDSLVIATDCDSGKRRKLLKRNFDKFLGFLHVWVELILQNAVNWSLDCVVHDQFFVGF